MRCLGATKPVWFPIQHSDRGLRPMDSEHDPFLQPLDMGEALPSAIRALHTEAGRYSGRCSITRGKGLLVALALRIGQFPPEGDDLKVTLNIRRVDGDWCWDRSFAGHQTRSRISFDQKSGCVRERIGGLTIWLRPMRTEIGLQIAIHRLSLYGIPCPDFLLPRSASTEAEDAHGRFSFDISARALGLGLLIRYRGWLTPDHEGQGLA